MYPRRFLWLLPALWLLLAFDYGTPILIRTETDVYELEAAGEIDEEYRNQLLDLVTDPLDPNRATREELYLLPGVTWKLAGRRPVVSLERAFVSLEKGGWTAFAGHYMAGFGQRLTFDVTDRARPDGLRHDLKLYEDYEKYDSYSVGTRLLGLAGARRWSLPESRELELTLFTSFNPHDLYTSYFQPNDFTITDPDEPEFSTATMPRLYREDLAGVNATVHGARGGHVGFTAWGGRAVKQFDFDFTNRPIPNRSFYGAAGADFAASAGLADFYGEAAVTDSGGTAARVETVLSPSLLELSAAFRYYGPEYDNPHSRGRSQPDTVGYYESESDDDMVAGGHRDRDEWGPQVQLTADPFSGLRLRLKGDLWQRRTLPVDDFWNAYAESRIDIDPLSWLGLDLVGSLRDKDIAVSGREYAYSYSSSDDQTEAEMEKGQKMAAGAGLRLDPGDRVVLQVFGKHTWEDHSSYDEDFARHRIDPPVEHDDGTTVEDIRLLCVDTAETEKHVDCYGPEATQWAEENLLDEQVTVYFDKDFLGQYERALGYVKLGNRFVNRELAREGLALPAADRYQDYTYCPSIMRAMERAWRDDVGGWGACDGSPWVYDFDE